MCIYIFIVDIKVSYPHGPPRLCPGSPNSPGQATTPPCNVIVKILTKAYLHGVLKLTN
mgnify:CR=1 FL=1